MSYCCPNQTAQGNGGVVCGGTVVVDIAGDAWSGYAGVWPLNESGDGTTGEFVDRTRFNLDASGGDGVDIELVPTIDEGVFCQPSQRFDGRQFIRVPKDTLWMGAAFSASLWGRIDTFYTPRVFYSRGAVTPDGDQWVFTLGYSFLNQAMASVQCLKTDGTSKTYTAVGSTMLVRNQWYHFAASFIPGDSLRVYVNGVQAAGVAVAERLTQPLTNDGYFSKWNAGGYITGNVQDVRLHASARSAEWFLAEFENYCSSGFYVVGGEEE